MSRGKPGAKERNKECPIVLQLPEVAGPPPFVFVPMPPVGVTLPLISGHISED